MKKLILLFALVTWNLTGSTSLNAQSSQLLSKWDALLSVNVNGKGMVNYEALKNDPKFDQVIKELSSMHPDAGWPADKEKAFWINVYNAFTIKLILDNWPVKSITDLDEPWDQPFIQLKDKTYTLNQIEHEILRPKFNDPRVHFAINCASFSCPVLPSEAITADKLDAQLDIYTKRFLLDKERNNVSRNKLELSKIFEWFGEDFEQAGGVRTFIEKHSGMKIDESAPISFKEYNWNLNDQ